jgi:hypothetical protein
MKPETTAKITHGFWGMVGGAGLAMIVGFNWGGWSTSSTTQKMNEAAVLENRAGICVAQFMSAPDHQAAIKELQGLASYLRADVIEKGGWDKMPGQEEATWGVASACAAELEGVVEAKT